MRIAVPEEIRQARRISEERERVLAQARQEAERTRSTAQEHANLLLSQQGIERAAETKAAEIITKARQHAEQLIADADAHCIAVLTALENEMGTIMATTRNGIQHLQAQRAVPAQRVQTPKERVQAPGENGIESGEKR
jgi:hypothetical protein